MYISPVGLPTQSWLNHAKSAVLKPKTLSFRSQGTSTQSSGINTPSLLDLLSGTGPSLCVNSDWTGLGRSLSDKLTAQKTGTWSALTSGSPLTFLIRVFLCLLATIHLHLLSILTLTILSYRGLLWDNQRQILIHAFASSCLDYCDSLFTCLSKWSLDHLQLVWNAAASLFTLSSRSCHITPIWASLHCLPIRLKIQFKVHVEPYMVRHWCTLVTSSIPTLAVG